MLTLPMLLLVLASAALLSATVSYEQSFVMARLQLAVHAPYIEVSLVVHSGHVMILMMMMTMMMLSLLLLLPLLLLLLLCHFIQLYNLLFSMPIQAETADCIQPNLSVYHNAIYEHNDSQMAQWHDVV